MKKVKFTSYKPQLKAKFKRAVAGTLEALGMKWQEIAVREINTQPRMGKLAGMPQVQWIRGECVQVWSTSEVNRK